MLRVRTAVLLLALAPGSCEPTEIRTRTEFAPDGSCMREVTYRFPEKEEAGKKTGEPEIPERLILPEREKWTTWTFEKTILVARGFFPRASDIPPDFRVKGKRAGRVLGTSISFRRDDFVLFERFRYAERFREPVDRDAMEASLSEAVETGVSLPKEVLHEALGRSFDLSEVDAWLDGDGARALRSLVVLWWEGLRDPDSERTVRRVCARLAREGIALKPEDIDPNGSEEALERVRAAFVKKVASLVRPPRPTAGRSPVVLPASAVDAMLPADRIVELFEEKAFLHFGGKGPAERWFEERLADAMGDLGGPDDKGLKFDCTVVLPGEIIRTNGVLLSPTEALWRFTSGSLFPNGSLLEAESIEIRHGALASLSGSKAFLTKRDVLDLIEAFTNEKGALKSAALKALGEGIEERRLEKVLERVGKVDASAAEQVRRVLLDSASLRPGR